MSLYPFLTDCDDCLIHGNHGYLEYPGVCEKYIQVYPDANGNKASTIRKCFGGLFWDNSAMVCRRPQEVECAYGKQQIEQHMILLLTHLHKITTLKRT